MAASYVDTSDGGRLSGSSLGYKIIDEFLSGMIITLTTFSALFTSLVFLFLCGGVFETASSYLYRA